MSVQLTLQACPFCGETLLHLQFTTGEVFQVACNGCGARGPTDDSRDGAMFLWEARMRPEPGGGASVNALPVSALPPPSPESFPRSSRR